MPSNGYLGLFGVWFGLEFGIGLVLFVSYTVTLNHFLEQAVYPPGLLDAEDAVIVT